MSYGLYKSGQGYWVRVLAAAMAGVVLLAACGWAWTQLEFASAYIPKTRVTLPMGAPLTGTGSAGQQVTLVGEPGIDKLPQVIGTAQVRSVSATQSGGGSVVIEKLSFTGKHDVTSIKGLRPAVGGATLEGRLAGTVQADELFPPVYLQGGGVALLMILGAAVTWWLVGSKPRTVEFLIATDGEMKKVNWSTKKDVTASTWVVIMWSVLLAAGLYLIDLLFYGVFKLLGVLEA